MEITNLNLAITTNCSRTCVNCSMGTNNMNGKNISFLELLNIATYFKGIDTITITGGEASLHPQLKKWIPKIKEYFGCKNLDLETNGNLFETMPEMAKYFDTIFVSDYGNLPKIEAKNAVIYDLKGKHIDKDTRKSGGCFRGTYKKVLYCDGLLYRCSSGYGAPNSKGIKLTDNWKEEIQQVPLNCENCLFSGSDL